MVTFLAAGQGAESTTSLKARLAEKKALVTGQGKAQDAPGNIRKQGKER
ncbi:MAG: hypothetical protein NC121_10960 [Blautia sp.]|nr:hypothetical protein [Blautia sp.]